MGNSLIVIFVKYRPILPTTVFTANSHDDDELIYDNSLLSLVQSVRKNENWSEKVGNR